MAVRIETMAEPLPGYRLIERLGGGGFGEVWKAEAPGGLFKAIKFVYGEISTPDNEDAMRADDDGVRADQEFTSLKRVLKVRHAFILSLEQIQVVDSQLIIVTELADRTLWDRFRECRGQGLAGIPREELLGYLEDTAEALDFMNDRYQLQHLDIKPQNLFLVENHVKVADFGLVKALQGMLASVTGGVTPVYAAPETFEGKVSRFSDQYSLSIVYQELLTGQRPYSGSTLRQLVMQHCQGVPELKSLPEHDRPLVGRALAKEYDKRFPSCVEFIETLRRAGEPSFQPTERPSSNHDLRLPVGPAGPAEPAGGEQTENGRLPKAEQILSGEALTRRPGAVARPPNNDQIPTNEVAIRSPSETPSDSYRGFATPSSSPSRPVIEVKPDGLLAPALVIGLGGLGLATLRSLRKEFAESWGSGIAVPAVRLLYIDTDPDTVQKATRGTDAVALSANELLLTRLHRPSHYIKARQGTTYLETWLPTNMLYRMQRQQTPAGIRALGRLAFVDNYRFIARRIQLELEACCAKEALEKTARETGLMPRTASPRVYIVAGLGGGTGSGMFLDMAYLVQHQLLQLGHTTSEVVGVCYLPPTERDPRRTAELANCFAALTEINHFSTGSAVFTARYELGEIRPGQPWFSHKGPPLGRCLFHPLPDGRESSRPEDADDAGLGQGSRISATVGAAARQVACDVTTALGLAIDEKRHPADGPTDATAVRTRCDRSPGHGQVRFQVSGQYRIVWPRRRLIARAADAACRRLVQRWMSKDSKPLKEVVKQWVAEKWEEQGLTAEMIIQRYQEECEKALGQSPEELFQTIHNALVPALTPKPSKNGEVPLNLTAVVETLEKLEQLVGVPEDCRPPLRAGEPNNYHPGKLELALQEMANKVVEQCDQKLAELAVGMIEDPHYRLAGAEEALRQLHSQIEQALLAHEQLAHEFQERASMLYKRIHTLTEITGGSVSTTSTWKPPFTRRPAAPQSANGSDLLELLRSYPKCRYQSLILQRVTSLYLSLRGGVSDQLREVDYCRARLGELRDLFRDPKNLAAASADKPASGRFIFGDGCQSLQDAVLKLDAGVCDAELLELDGRIQKLIRKQFKALVDVCYTRAANVLRALAPAMHGEASSFLRNRLGDANVVGIYLENFERGGPDPEHRLQNDLSDAYDAAVPEVTASSPASEVNMFAVPPEQGEDRLREALKTALDGSTLASARSTDELVIYREHTLGTLADLKQMGPVGQEAYVKVSAQEHFTPHSRSDIPGWASRDSKAEA
jgi:serine/threonine protein kinase